MKSAIQERKKDEEKLARRAARPEILSTSRALAQTKDKDVVSRLYDRQKEYAQKLRTLAERIIEKAPTIRTVLTNR